LILQSAWSPVFSTHIVGGEMTYLYLGNNQYKLRLDVYIDCINGSSEAISSDAQAYISVFNGSSKRILNGYPVLVARKGPERLEKTNYNCILVKPNACVDHYYYETTVTLAPNTGGYFVSFQRCCRNGTITNIVDPGGTGANYWVFIPDARVVGKANSSAVFKQLPPNFLCTNTALKFDHSAVDPDGDSLVYTLTTPYTAANSVDPRPDNRGNGTIESPPFTQIQWKNFYSEQLPIDGAPFMKIDSFNGFLTLTPTKVGQFVVGISVKEYRKGVLVSEVIRDYQFNVQACKVDVVASFFAPKFICGYTFQFQNLSSGAQRYHWDFGVDSSNTDTSNSIKPTFTYPKEGIYKVKLYAYKTTCTDSFDLTVNVVKPIFPKLPKDTIICPGSVYKLKSNIKGSQYLWNGSPGPDSILVKSPGTYILGVAQQTCVWYDTIQIGMDNSKVVASGDTIYCTYDIFSKKIQCSSPFPKSVKWSNGATDSIVFVSTPGKYSVIATSIFNCVTKDTIEIMQFPEINVYLNDTVACPSNVITLSAWTDRPLAKFYWENQNNASTNTFQVNSPGKYVVKVVEGYCIDRDTCQLKFHPNVLDFGGDKRFCNRVDTVFTAPRNDFRSIIWNKTVNSTSFRATKEGKLYIDVINSNGCLESDSIQLDLFPNPNLNLGNDTILCLSEKPILDAGPGMLAYKWNNGNKSQRIIAYDSGLYIVEVTDFEGCKSRDSIWINKKKDLYSSDIFMPNAFTPNGDDLNDLYPNVKYEVKGAHYDLKLYNRWGEKLLETNSPDGNWDGLIYGKPAPEGVYVFKLTWIGCDNYIRTQYGDFTLLR
jgi:gliding motility-associated-like protein